MKKLLAFLAVFLMFSITASAALILEYDGKKHNYTGAICDLEVNGESVETPLHPIIFNNRALVPVREVFEALGADVTYISGSQKIMIEFDDTFITMQIGSPYVFVNGVREAIPDGVVPKLIAKEGEYAKTMVPVRFVSETLGMTVNYDAENTLISIFSPDFNNKTDKNEDNFNNNGDKEEIITPVTPDKVYSTTAISLDISSSDDDAEDDTIVDVTITVKMSDPIEEISEIKRVGESGVIFCDIFDADLSDFEDTVVDLGPVAKVRFGIHDEYARIAIDPNVVDDYSVSLSSNKTKLTITITGCKERDEIKTEEDDIIIDDDEDKIEKIEGKIVVLDAGHGGTDPGAVYTHGSVTYYEKTINLAVAKKVKALLEKEGVTVKMTRTGDSFLELSDRSAYANSLGAVMFVSIHSNSFPSNEEVNGIEVYYARTNNSDSYGITSYNLANDIYNNLIKNTSATKRGVKTAQHLVTRTSKMPAVLIELGFITNKTEAANLTSSSYQDLLAQAIAKAILRNIDSVEKPTVVSNSLDEDAVEATSEKNVDIDENDEVEDYADEEYSDDEN